MANDFKKSIENCRIIAFDSYPKNDGSRGYMLGVLQGREFCRMISCDESIGKGFDDKTMFDKPCRIFYRSVTSKNGENWDVVTGVDFIKQQEK